MWLELEVLDMGKSLINFEDVSIVLPAYADRKRMIGVVRLVFTHGTKPPLDVKGDITHLSAVLTRPTVLQ